ncbi:MAG: hypothetical protein KDI82_00105 [Gammaproteobacteria bacterium]|nr:hypothetical protein [Gammaproteobacteria bacterium]
MKNAFIGTSLYGLVILVSGAFAGGSALASDLVVVDRTHSEVLELKLQNGRERESHVLQAGSGPAFGITIDEEKNIYVTHQGDEPEFDGSVVVKRYGSDSFELLVPADAELNGGLGKPFYPIVRGDTLFVSSWLTHQVLMFDKNTGESLGAFVDVDATTGLGEGGLVNPRGIVFGPEGNLYVNSSGTDETLVYDGESGEYLGVFLDTAAHGIHVPCGVVFDHRGWVAIASASTNVDVNGEYEGGFAFFDWDGNLLRRERAGGVCGLERTPDGKLLAGATQLEQIRIYSLDWEEGEYETLREGAKFPDMTLRRYSKPRWDKGRMNPRRHGRSRCK